MNTRFLYALILSVVFNLVKAQDAPNVVPVSPEAAALAKMVNYPINHNTGIPNINIPFHEVSVGNLKLPIVLNYHAGGFKINERSTRVGLGWSLSCDLQITRTINGIDDFTGVNKGYINNDFVKSYDGSYNNYYPTYDSSNLLQYFWKNAKDLANGIKDGMPDKFNYKLLNKSGSFYFHKDNVGGYSIVPLPYDNIKITYNDGTFRIVDTDGTVYEFGVTNQYAGNSTTKKEITNGKITSWKCHKIISNNKVDEISFIYENKTSETIKSYPERIEYFNNANPCNLDYYTQGNYNDIPSSQFSTDYIIGEPFHYLSSPKYWVYSGNQQAFHLPYIDNQDNLTDRVFWKNVNVSSTLIDGISLKEINLGRGGKVILTGKDQLSSIKVEDQDGVEIKSLKLYHDIKTTYYNGSYTDGTRYLDSLHVSNGTTAYQKYDLLYKEKFDFGDHLMGHDAWGYCNSSTQNIPIYSSYGNIYNPPTLSMPNKVVTQDFVKEQEGSIYNSCSWLSNVDISIGGTDNWSEYANEERMQRGILKRIVYPTGGAVDFDFESNKYLKNYDDTDNTYSADIPEISGGLRVRSINYLDKDFNIKSQKYYRYGNLEEGTGIVLDEPKRTSDVDKYYYGIENYSQNMIYMNAGGTNSSCETNNCLELLAHEVKTTYRPVSALDYTYASGAPIYYTKVSEYQQDFGIQTGKTVYSYYEPNEIYDNSHYLYFNNDHYSLNYISGTPLRYQKTDWYLGAQKSVEHFKYDAALGFAPISKKSFEYDVYSKANTLGKISVSYAFQKNIKAIVEGNYGSSVSDHWENKQFSSITENDFVDGTYGIPIGKLLLKKEKEEVFEDEGTITTVNDFFYDDIYPIQPERIETTNSQGDVIKTEFKYAYDFSGGIYDDMVTDNMLTQLVEEKITNVTDNKILSQKRINYSTQSVGFNPILPDNIQTSVKGEALKTAITFDAYDQYGNILQFTKSHSYPTSFIWGYSGKYPVAKLENVPYSSISTNYINNVNITNPSSESALLNVLTSIRTDYNTLTKMVSTYSYKENIGITSTTDPKDYSQYYEYDPIGRLITQKDNNQKIIQSLEYHTRDFRNTTPYYYNFPKMISIGYDCATGVVDNHIVQGGNYNSTSTYSTEAANQNALSALYNTPNTFTGCASAASLEFQYLYITYQINGITYAEPHPSKMEIDFIQNGSIVATQRIIPNNVWSEIPAAPTNLLLNDGDYEVSFRMDADVKYSDSFPTFALVDPTTGYNKIMDINQGDTISLENGKSYLIRVTMGYY